MSGPLVHDGLLPSPWSLSMALVILETLLLTESDAVHRSCPKDWLKPVLDALACEEDQVLQATTAGKIEGLCSVSEDSMVRAPALKEWRNCCDATCCQFRKQL